MRSEHMGMRSEHTHMRFEHMGMRSEHTHMRFEHMGMLFEHPGRRSNRHFVPLHFFLLLVLYAELDCFKHYRHFDIAFFVATLIA